MQNKQDNAGCVGEASGLSPTVNSATPYRGDRHISAYCYRHRLILPPLSTREFYFSRQVHTPSEDQRVAQPFLCASHPA